MRVDLHLTYESLPATLSFYIELLGYFELAQDYGMGDVRLRSTANPDVCLALVRGSAPALSRPAFTMSTGDADAELDRIRALDLPHGAGLVAGPSGEILLDYPLGRTFTLCDPSGNLLSVCQWHSGAS